MILLLGGTSETADVATRLAEIGYKVLVSTATDAELAIGNHPNITRRTGRLNCEEMTVLVHEQSISAIVDVTHPYAAAARMTASLAAENANVPYLTFIRPSTTSTEDNVVLAKDHDEAAVLAFSFGKPVLLTTGSRNLEPYIRESRRTNIPLIARALDHTESRNACRAAGLRDEQVIFGRGPFSVDENRATIRKHNIGVLVTKNSGKAGGVEEKLDAAGLEDCRVVVIQRPEQIGLGVYNSIDGLVDEVGRTVGIIGLCP